MRNAASPRSISSHDSASATKSSPAPPYSSGITIPSKPSSAMPSITSMSRWWLMSFSIAFGSTRSSTKSRTVCWIRRCSSVSSKSIAVSLVQWERIATSTDRNQAEFDDGDRRRVHCTGVSFALTDEQSDLRALAHDFAEKEIRPVAAEYDEHQTHPADVIAKAHELGLMNVHIPKSLGGPGLSIFDGILIGEELSWGCSGIAVSLVANTLGSAPVLLAGTDEQKQTWLPPLLEEPFLCSFALTEPNAGSDVSGIQTTAERHGDDYVLNGSKMFISNAGHAAWIVVFASTDKSKAQRGPLRVRRPGRHRRRHRREAPRQDGPAGDRHVRARASRT